MNLLRVVAGCFLERGELLDRNVQLAKENTRLQQECAATKQALRHAVCARDDALGVVCDLRADVAALHRQVAVLMDFTPSDLRAMGEGGPFDQEGQAG